MKKGFYLLLSVLMACACLLVSGCKKQLPTASLYVSLDPSPEAWQGPVCINSENDGLELTIPYDGVPRMLAIRCEFYSKAYGKYVQPVEATRWMSVTYENGELPNTSPGGRNPSWSAGGMLSPSASAGRTTALRPII